MKKFEFIPGATADVIFRAYGRTLNQAFANSALAFFNVMTDTKGVKPALKFTVEKSSEDLKSLLYDFLEELLYIHETKRVFLSKFSVKVDEATNSLKAVVYGEKIKKSHKGLHEVKAITYSNMLIDKTSTGYVIQAVPDI